MLALRCATQQRIAYIYIYTWPLGQERDDREMCEPTEFTVHDYLKTVESIAAECQTEYPDPDNDERNDYICESVDGNRYVIYYTANEIVLRASFNEPDGAEVQAMAGDKADWRTMRMIAAYLAMEADVHQTLERLDGETAADLRKAS